MNENEVFKAYMLASGEDKAKLERDLIRLLRRHAFAIVWTQLGLHRPDIVNWAVFLALKHADRFRDESKFSTYFQRIVSNVCKAELSTLIKQKEREIPLEDFEEEIPLEPENNEHILDNITVAERDLFDLKCDGFSMKEIGNRLGLSEDAAKMRWMRLKRKLEDSRAGTKCC